MAVDEAVVTLVSLDDNMPVVATAVVTVDIDVAVLAEDAVDVAVALCV